MEGLLKMNTVLNSKSESTYVNLGREESVSHQGLKVIQEGKKDSGALGKWMQGAFFACQTY